MQPDNDSERQQHRFVIHVWREPSASESPWRGSVYEVSTAVSIVSAKLRDLWDFIALRLGQTSDAPVGGETPRDE